MERIPERDYVCKIKLYQEYFSNFLYKKIEKLGGVIAPMDLFRDSSLYIY